MNTGDPNIDDRKLMNYMSPKASWGECIGFWSTTYEFQADFFETDFLPTLLALGAWDDRHWTSRISMERSLSNMEACCVMIDARGYRGRPRSLRVDIFPNMASGGLKQHAKVSLFVFEQAVCLMVGSTNLTEPGYRKNIEVATSIVVTREDPSSLDLLQSAIKKAPDILSTWWNKSAETVNNLALKWLAELATSTHDSLEWFVWSGGKKVPLWRQFLDRWPNGEIVKSITIVSPFWSDEDGSGPVAMMTKALNKRGLISKDLTLNLITEGLPIGKNSWHPVLPASYATYDFRKIGVSAFAQRVDPVVTKQEVMIDGFLDNRKLHAKVVLFQGKGVSQVYLGSANFTRKGWGFLSAKQFPNIEAGLILQEAKGNSTHFLDMIPKTAGNPIPLTGNCNDSLLVPEKSDDAPIWPTFIEAIQLRQSRENHAELILSIQIVPERITGAWHIGLIDRDKNDPPVCLYKAPKGMSKEKIIIPLTKEYLQSLLKEQEVIVTWWANEDGAHYPINVSPDAKFELPISPDSGLPNENMLLAYYQGRIAYEDLFPPEDGGSSRKSAETKALESGVDTSNIQSYQIREFVESLEGVRKDLKKASTSSRTMRSALRGPVSPLSLARAISEKVSGGSRTLTAGAFQLVEILQCLEETRSMGNYLDWAQDLNETSVEIKSFLENMISSHPDILGSGTRFYEYQSRLIGNIENVKVKE